MKIGIDASFMSGKMTGIGFYIYYNIMSMAKMDYDTEFYVYMNSSPQCELDLPENWHVKYSNNMNFFVWQLLVLPKWVNEDEIEILWEPCNRLPRVPKNIKLVLTVHDLGSYLYREYCSLGTFVLERLFLKKSCRQADLIIADSDYTSNDIQRYLGISESKIVRIYCGGDEQKSITITNDKYLAVKNKYNIECGYFLVLGTISNRKNPLVILKAYKKYRDIGGEKQLVFAGKNAMKKGVLESTIKALNLGKYVIITGYISEVEKRVLYTDAVAVIFTSRYEGFGYPLLEAMSIGTPVITSRISSLPEVGGNDVAYLDDIDDYSGLSKLLIRYDEMSEDERAQIVKNGINRAKIFSKEKCAKDILRVLKGLK